MKKYFLHNGTENIGPFNQEELKEQKITKDTPIWYEGIADWTSAGEIDELKSILASTPPPFTKKTPPEFKAVTKKKSKTLKYVLIAVAGFVLLILLLLGFSKTQNSSYDDEIETYPAAESAVDDGSALRTIRNSIEENIIVTTNDYTIDVLGGITNLDIKVTNTTDYKIDAITVAVDYIKESGEVYKKEYVTFSNIPAHQDKTASAPDSDRGTSVEVKAEAIYSKKLNLCYDGTVAPYAGDPDPFLCK